jgi:hypothetical protein
VTFWREVQGFSGKGESESDSVKPNKLPGKPDEKLLSTMSLSLRRQRDKRRRKL